MATVPLWQRGYTQQSTGLFLAPTNTAAQTSAAAGNAATGVVGTAGKKIPSNPMFTGTYFMREFKRFGKKLTSGAINWGSGHGRLGMPFKIPSIPVGIAGRIAFGAVVFGATLGGNALGAAKRKVRWNREIERPSSLRAGPGFISWSKQTGMPSNHLSTDGLSLALSRTRHVSLI